LHPAEMIATRGTDLIVEPHHQRVPHSRQCRRHKAAKGVGTLLALVDPLAAAVRTASLEGGRERPVGGDAACKLPRKRAGGQPGRMR
jgi:hypothetical protein